MHSLQYETVKNSLKKRPVFQRNGAAAAVVAVVVVVVVAVATATTVAVAVVGVDRIIITNHYYNQRALNVNERIS